jgi:hypothetical protein
MLPWYLGKVILEGGNGNSSHASGLKRVDSEEGRKMKKVLVIAFWVGGFITGMSLLERILPLGFSSSAYATPNKGSDCSKCHGAKSSSPKAPKGVFTDTFMTDQCDGFSSEGNNPYFVLQPDFQLVLNGTEGKVSVHLTITVRNETKTFPAYDLGGGETADVVTRVVEEVETRSGILAEISRNYFAICNRTNSVFYFGEDVDIYDATGQNVIDHAGSWLAGVNGAKAGIAMPGTILVGARYYQEVAPGLAMDRSEILGMNGVLTTPAKTFQNVLQTLETSALDKDKGYKFYAPRVGLIRDQYKGGFLELTDYTR